MKDKKYKLKESALQTLSPIINGEHYGELCEKIQSKGEWNNQGYADSSLEEVPQRIKVELIEVDTMLGKVKGNLSKKVGLFTEQERQDIGDFLNEIGSIDSLNNLAVDYEESKTPLPFIEWLKSR